MTGVDLVLDLRPKRCPRCTRTLPLEAFSIDRRSPDGRHWRCRDCNAEYLRANRHRYHYVRHTWHAEIIVGDEAALIAALGRPGTFATSSPFPAR